MKNSKEYNHAYYLRHKTKIVTRLQDRHKSRRNLIREAKSKPCADCGVQYPYWIMQFDHVRGKKSFNVGMMLYKRGIKKLKEEIEKCDIVCANCHANRTYCRQTALSSSD